MSRALHAAALLAHGLHDIAAPKSRAPIPLVIHGRAAMTPYYGGARHAEWKAVHPCGVLADYGVTLQTSDVRWDYARHQPMESELVTCPGCKGEVSR